MNNLPILVKNQPRDQLLQMTQGKPPDQCRRSAKNNTGVFNINHR